MSPSHMPCTEYDIAIVGAGIVGSALAARLAPHARILLLDRDLSIRGSTGRNPGFVGQLNNLPPLTELARRSVHAYRKIPGGFDDVGGLEVALTKPELEHLRARGALASASGLKATLVSGTEARRLAPAFVEDSVGGLHFPDDGVADPKVLTVSFQAAATAAGAVLLDADVLRFKDGVLETSAGIFTAARVAVCTGIWAQQLLPLHAAVVVGQGYAYSATHRARTAAPFVRWPAAQVYARDHGTVDGIGSYDHAPVRVAPGRTAVAAWDKAFNRAIERALALLPEQTAVRFENRITAGMRRGKEDAAQKAEEAEAAVVQARGAGRAYAFNSLFQVTPDGCPLVGRVREGVYAAVGVWVTHAAGAAGLLADMMLEDMGRGEPKDIELRKALDPLRFAGRDVVDEALRTYNDIYTEGSRKYLSRTPCTSLGPPAAPEVLMSDADAEQRVVSRRPTRF